MTKAERAERSAWLASLKEGDEVALLPMERGRPRDNASPSLRTISGVTVDAIRLAGSDSWANRPITLEADGIRRKTSHSIAIMVVPVTDEMRRTWKAQDCRDRLCRAFSNYSTARGVSSDKVIRMAAILDEPEPTAEGGGK